MKRINVWWNENKEKGEVRLIKQVAYGGICMLLGAILGLRAFAFVLIPAAFLLLGYYLGNKTKEDKNTNIPTKNTNVPKKPNSTSTTTTAKKQPNSTTKK